MYGHQNLTQPATRLQDMLKQFSWVLIGNLVYGVSQWGMLVVLAHVGTVEMVGQFALSLAVTAPVFLLFGMQLRSIQATDAQGRRPFATYMWVRVMSSLVAMIAVVVIVLMSGYTKSVAILVLMIGLAKSLESVSDIIYGLFQQKYRMKQMGISMITKGVLSLFSLGLFTYAFRNLNWGAVGLVVAWGALLFAYDLRWASTVNRSVVSVPPRYAEWWGLVRHALPLGISGMLTSLMFNVPRFFVERYQGPAALGYYAALASFMVPGGLIITALGQSVSPRLARLYQEDLRGFKKLLGWTLVAGAAVGVGGVLVALVAGRPLLVLLFGPSYSVHTSAFLILMGVSGVLQASSCFEFGLTAAQSLKSQAWLFACVTVLVTVGCAVMVPDFGLPGAAVSLLVAQGVRLVGSSTLLRALVKRRSHPDLSE